MKHNVKSLMFNTKKINIVRIDVNSYGVKIVPMSEIWNNVHRRRKTNVLN